MDGLVEATFVTHTTFKNKSIHSKITLPLSNILHVRRSLNIVMDNTIIKVFDLDADMSIRVPGL